MSRVESETEQKDSAFTRKLAEAHGLIPTTPFGNPAVQKEALASQEQYEQWVLESAKSFDRPPGSQINAEIIVTTAEPQTRYPNGKE